jgi:hypothetical protein
MENSRGETNITPLPLCACSSIYFAVIARTNVATLSNNECEFLVGEIRDLIMEERMNPPYSISACNWLVHVKKIYITGNVMHLFKE